MGTHADTETRERKIRVGDEELTKKVKAACRKIFRHGAGINSARVKEILQNESLVPPYVSFYYVSIKFLTHSCSRMHFLNVFPTIHSTFFACW